MESSPVAILLHGASGRMGASIRSLIPKIEGVRLRGVLKLRDSGADMGMPYPEGVAILRAVPKTSAPGDVVIDFSHPTALVALLEALMGSGLPLVCGTTGLQAAERELLEVYSKESPVFYEENMSYGISVLKKLLHLAAPLLVESSDVEVVEYHHRGKADFPSGTALMLADLLAPGSRVVTGRGEFAHPARTAEERLHVHSVRLGGIAGQHDIHFGLDDEVVTLSHRALSRDVFARGAIRAAQFVANKNKGFFAMSDLLGAKDG